MNRLKAKLKHLTIERQAAGVGSQGTQATGPCRLVKEEVYESMQEAVKKVCCLLLGLARIRDYYCRLEF